MTTMQYDTMGRIKGATDRRLLGWPLFLLTWPVYTVGRWVDWRNRHLNTGD